MDGKKFKIAVFLLIVALIIIWRNQEKISTIEAENESLVDEISEWEYALSRANDNIEEANDSIERANESIEEALGYLWASYDEMGEAIENLVTAETADIVSSP